MVASDVDAYLTDVAEPGRHTLQQLRSDIRALLPAAQECISYGMPGFKVQGHVVAGFAAFTKHLSYLPHSGSVLPTLADDLAGYTMTKSSLHFAPDRPLPRSLVRKLLETRLRESGIDL